MRVLAIFTVVFILSCQSTSTSSLPSNTPSVAWDGGSEYEMEDLGSGVQLAVKKDAEGVIVEKGLVFNGTKNGVWTTYYRNGEPHILASYVDGKKNGDYIEYDTKGRFKTVSYYANDQLHGVLKEFEFYTQKKEESYRHGKLNGVSKEFVEYGVVFRTISYKDNVIDGPMQYFNPEGKMTMEYIYKNGERVEGGMVK